MKPPSDITALTVMPEDPAGAIAQRLIAGICAELNDRYGTPPSPFSPEEASAPRTVFLVARLNGLPVGCGAIRRLDETTAEAKRMYVDPSRRRRGIARAVLAELERRAIGFGYRAIRLETGILQPEARQLYETSGFREIPRYGKYVDKPTSVCYEKIFT